MGIDRDWSVIRDGVVCALGDADELGLQLSNDADLNAAADLVADHLAQLLASGILVRRARGRRLLWGRRRATARDRMPRQVTSMGRTTRHYAGIPIGSLIKTELLGYHLWVSNADRPEVSWNIWADDESQVEEWLKVLGVTPESSLNVPRKDRPLEGR